MGYGLAVLKRLRALRAAFAGIIVSCRLRAGSRSCKVLLRCNLLVVCMGYGLAVLKRLRALCSAFARIIIFCGSRTGRRSRKISFRCYLLVVGVRDKFTI